MDRNQEGGVQMSDRRTAVAHLLRVLNTAWPRIQRIEWELYGSLSRFEPGGDKLKYQDGLLLVYEEDVLLRKLELGSPSGDRLTEMIEVADLKVQLARQARQGCSAELRDPEHGRWAGGVKVPGTQFCLALTGLPEVADHFLLAILLRLVRLITPEHHALLIDSARTIGLADAMKRVSLDTTGSWRLCRELERTLSLS